MSVRITVISGFLGAGKTTLIKNLLESHAFGHNPVLIENDYGTIDANDSSLKETGVIIKDVSAGCICCSVAGDFIKSVQEVINACHPEHLIIEPAGTSKLSDIVELLQKDALRSTCDIVQLTAITVINLQKFWHNDKYVSEYFWNQIRSANILLLNNAGHMTEEEIIEICACIRAHHSTGIILKQMNPETIERIKNNLVFSMSTPMISMRSAGAGKTRFYKFHS